MADTLQAQIDSFAVQRQRLGSRHQLGAKSAPLGPDWAETAPNAPDPAYPKRFNRPVRIGEIPLPWWNSDLTAEE